MNEKTTFQKLHQNCHNKENNKKLNKFSGFVFKIITNLYFREIGILQTEISYSVLIGIVSYKDSL